MKTSREYQTFSNAMGTILKADPRAVKAAIDTEKLEHKLEAQRTGKRGRGRPSKHSSSLGHAVS